MREPSGGLFPSGLQLPFPGRVELQRFRFLLNPVAIYKTGTLLRRHPRTLDTLDIGSLCFCRTCRPARGSIGNPALSVRVRFLRASPGIGQVDWRAAIAPGPVSPPMRFLIPLDTFRGLGSVACPVSAV